MRCGLALLHWRILEIANENYYNYQVLKKRFIISQSTLDVRSTCGKCLNKN